MLYLSSYVNSHCRQSFPARLAIRSGLGPRVDVHMVSERAYVSAAFTDSLRRFRFHPLRRPPRIRCRAARISRLPLRLSGFERRV